MRFPPLIVWGGALATAVVLYFRQEEVGAIRGFASEVRYSVASEVPGRLKRLDVSLHQEVTEGQVVGALDEKALLLDLHESRAELERLRAELERESVLVQTEAAVNEFDSHAQLRRFARDVENARIDYLEGMADLAEDKIVLQGLELILDRSRALNEVDLAPLAAYDDDRVTCEALKTKISRSEPLLQAMQQCCHEAEVRYDRFVDEWVDQSGLEDTLLKPSEYALKVQGVRIEQVNLAITQLVLRAPASGCVSQIFKRPGETLFQGEAVVAILEPRSREVVAYVPEEKILHIDPGSSVRLRRKADPGSLIQGTVAFLGEEIEQLPIRLNPVVTIPQWGLAVTIALPETVRVKPGEAFEVMF